ncbi:MAG: pectinesterase [Deltaproteobacteria bacterium]|nr:pectinesterase [Deltaproteobacteria bacterium]
MRTVLRCAVLYFFLSPKLLIGAEKVSEFPVGWSEVKPGGDTVCARGDEFSFFVHSGSVNKVVVDFIGGGACWNKDTCSPDSPTFTETVDELRDRVQREGLQGLYDKTDERNPTKDWHHVVIPYCTGDIHWGANDATYTKDDGSTFTVRHRGAINAQAVLTWLHERVQDPERILVTGCSAGAYGSIYWTPHVRKMFPHSSLVQFADSGNGVITEDFQKMVDPRWNFKTFMPRWIPDVDPDRVDVTKIHLDEWYRIAGHFYPDVSFSQYSSINDGVQTFFYELMGGDPALWSEKLRASVSKLAAQNSNYRHFVSPGEEHCILPFDRFYSEQSKGQPFLRWFTDYISGKDVENVICENCEGLL